ncbi:MAG TPA: ABC transporter ATP-binding protein [Puia sp.]|jgi:lipopolysaccharide transport system ATP-binding protein|nr:ABC transporter ATP-binding protein [Puia sp.]
MTPSVIKVEQLSKRFIISHESQEKYTSLRDVIAKRARNLIGKGNNASQVEKEEFYALKDVNFDIQPGDRLGVIGRNGAGKSTLLKILSRITEPTTGRISIRGRVASLLEVGTGFHPELTGRENIFLNGAILGMSRAEIRRKFDEIVDFAEIVQFLDTPVKRYSSGMYVRLAFAVAAHLEPEILIVDEVLAVGDAQFQKKCLGKMEDVSKDGGRTVIFVSHNMTAIQSLCNKGLFMNKGQVLLNGPIDACVREYLENGVQLTSRYEPALHLNSKSKSNDVEVLAAELYKNQLGIPVDILMIEDSLLLHIRYKLNKKCVLNLSLVLWTQKEDCVFNVCTDAGSYEEGVFESTLTIPANFLNDEVYTMELYFIENTSKALLRIEDMIVFEMHESTRDANWYEKWPGIIRPKLDFKITKG